MRPNSIFVLQYNLFYSPLSEADLIPVLDVCMNNITSMRGNTSLPYTITITALEHITIIFSLGGDYASHFIVLSEKKTDSVKGRVQKLN